MASNVRTSDWRIVAEQASKEMDGEKLAALVKQLCEAMDAEALFPLSLAHTALTCQPNPPRSAGDL
jgi:hypothetical protein